MYVVMPCGCGNVIRHDMCMHAVFHLKSWCSDKTVTMRSHGSATYTMELFCAYTRMIGQGIPDLTLEIKMTICASSTGIQNIFINV